MHIYIYIYIYIYIILFKFSLTVKMDGLVTSDLIFLLTILSCINESN